MKHLMFIVLLCTLFSCKKTNETDQISPGMSTADGQDWFAKNMAPSVNNAKKGTVQPQVLNPRWDRAVQSEDADSYIMEVPVDFSTHHSLALATAGRSTLPDPDKNAVKFFLLKNKRSSLISPVVMNILGNEKVNASDFHYGVAGNNFSGKVFYTTLSGDFIKGQAYINGKATGIISPLNKSGQALPPNCEETQVGIYSQTCYYYTDGSEECDPEILLYIITYEVCGSGGGPGAPPPTTDPCSNTAQQAQAFLNAGGASANFLEEAITSQTPVTMEKTYRWQIFQAVTWWVDSYEHATMELVHYTNPDYSRWEYTGFSHLSLQGRGTSIGGSRTFQHISSNANIDRTRQSVWVTENFSVTSTPGGVTGCSILFPPVTVSYTTSTRFYAQYS